MKLLLENKLRSVWNRIKLCMKYYSNYFALFTVAIFTFVGFAIFRVYKENSGIVFGNRISFFDVVKLMKYEIIVIGILLFYELTTLIIKLYQQKEKAYKYLPIRKLDILVSEIVMVMAISVGIMVLPICYFFLILKISINFYLSLFVAVLILVLTQVIFPIVTYQYLIRKSKKQIGFAFYLFVTQLVMMAQHSLYIWEISNIIYISLLVIEFIITILIAMSMIKNPNELFFYEIKKHKTEYRQQIFRTSQYNLILREMRNNGIVLLQFIAIPSLLVILSKILEQQLFQIYIYYYMAFIPCFFIGMYTSYQKIYKLIPMKVNLILLERFIVGMSMMLLVEIFWFRILNIQIIMSNLINSICFSVILYIFVYAAELKLIVNQRENPYFYIILMAIQYAYATIVLYIQEFFAMGFNYTLEDYKISLILLAIVSVLILVKNGLKRLRE